MQVYTRPFDWAQGLDGGGIAFFLWWMTRELQISARQGLEGRAQPVPAGVRSATRGMEPEGGTPESASKKASLPFLCPGFLQKPASFSANI